MNGETVTCKQHKNEHKRWKPKVDRNDASGNCKVPLFFIMGR